MPEAGARLARVYRYHDGTKHHFNRFARSTGFLDWASQPRPFRSFDGANSFALHPRPDAPASAGANPPSASPSAIRSPHCRAVGEVLRHSLGLSAWKQFRESRWALRVNPSSGNLHPTEAYVVAGPMTGLAGTPAVYHYAPDRHALEQRAAFGASAWSGAVADPFVWLIALTSIHWREAWKYGERAFRYCQHDMGHAVAAVRLAADMGGWRARLLPEWSHAEIAALTGIDRDEDFFEAEREEPGVLIEVSREPSAVDREALVAAVGAGAWTGHASQLSEEHVTWTFIDEAADATRDSGRVLPARPVLPAAPGQSVYPAALLLQRRSAVSFDSRHSIDAAVFLAMLARVMPSGGAPWDALWWDARIHLVLFVHRVDGVPPGMYLLARDASVVGRLKAACGREFLWEPAGGTLPLFLLARGDCRALAQRLSCDQEIAADGFFSLGMIADFDASLAAFGPAFYRHLFWESGVVGQVLYLEAEAAGARGTGIGCFYDDPVHDVLGLTGHAFQSLYHFTIGVPVEDSRLTTEPGYDWEVRTQN